MSHEIPQSHVMFYVSAPKNHHLAPMPMEENKEYMVTNTSKELGKEVMLISDLSTSMLNKARPENVEIF